MSSSQTHANASQKPLALRVVCSALIGTVSKTKMKTQEPCMQEGGSPIQCGIGNGLGACKPVERDGDHAVMGILGEMVSREPSIANADELARGGGAAIEQDAEECRKTSASVYAKQ